MTFILDICRNVVSLNWFKQVVGKSNLLNNSDDLKNNTTTSHVNI